MRKIISAVYPFEQADRAFSDFAQHSADMLKVMIEF